MGPFQWLFIVACYGLALWLPTTCGQLNQVILGLVDDRMMEYATEALSDCQHSSRILLEAIPRAEGTSILQRADSLRASLEKKNYLTVIGPAVEHVMLASEALDIPYLTTNNHNNTLDGKIYALLPDFPEVIHCVWAVLKHYKWRTVSVLWEKSIFGDAMLGLLDADRLEVHAYRIDNYTVSAQIRQALRHVREKRFQHVVILTHPRTSAAILDTAMKLGMLAVPYSYLIAHFGNVTDFDAMVNDIETNLTIIQVCPDALPMDPNGLLFTDKYAVSKGIALICDILDKSPASLVKSLSFDELMNQILSRGGELPVNFDPNGNRVEFSWDVAVHDTREFVTIAQWHKLKNSTSVGRLELSPYEVEKQSVSWMEQIRVVSILERPWTMLRPGQDENCRGNHCYQGFMVDLMEHVANQFSPHLKYKFYIVPDGRFGSLDRDTGLWNGIMAELVSKNATMSLAPLSINKQREQAVDFTKPFKTRGISLLIRTPVSETSFFQFLAPLSTTIWFVVLVAMVVVGVALGQFEKHGIRHRHDIARITPRESFWFVFGSLVQEGTESTPLTIGGRILTAAWWFFAMILLSSYTANLAAFLTVKKINAPIESVSDLLTQSKIQYGTVRNSGVLAFFKNTQIEPYRTMWSRMSPDQHVASSHEGLQRVLNENYAFLWDDTVTKYEAAMNCNFTEVGPSFDPKGYGIGVPQGAVYRENLTLALLSLADQGIIDSLYHKWWNQGDCARSGSSSDQSAATEEMHIENIAGIFFVLLAGLVLGLLACLVDKYIVPAVRQKQNPGRNSLRPDNEQPGKHQNSSNSGTRMSSF